MEFTRPGLEIEGFVGFNPVDQLRSAKCSSVPRDSAGVYVVLVPPCMDIAFLPRSPAGHFKNQDPTVSVSTLRARWVHGVSVIYIGRASKTRSTNLRKRIHTFLKFGGGENVGHRGGRFVWQIADSDRFLIGWKPCAESRKLEADMLSDFERQYGRLPFANLKRESGD